MKKRQMTSDEATEILIDVCLGRPAPEAESEERAAFRAKMVQEVAEIYAAGGIVEIPSEIP